MIDNDFAIEILNFIKQHYEKDPDKSGTKKYVEALQKGIDAINNEMNVTYCYQCEYAKKIDDFGNYKCALLQHTFAGHHYCGYGKHRKDAEK